MLGGNDHHIYTHLHQHKIHIHLHSTHIHTAYSKHSYTSHTCVWRECTSLRIKYISFGRYRFPVYSPYIKHTLHTNTLYIPASTRYALSASSHTQTVIFFTLYFAWFNRLVDHRWKEIVKLIKVITKRSVLLRTARRLTQDLKCFCQRCRRNSPEKYI